MRFRTAALVFGACTIINPVVAVSQSLTSVDIDKITETANIICNQLQLTGSSSTIALSAEAEAEARLLLRSLGSAAGDLDISGYVSKFENVPRAELKDFLTSAQDCRLDVFRELRDLAGSKPQPGQLAWNFPHVIKEGVALGVISVRRNGGSGVDVNFRARNTLDVPVYVYFGLPSYTDNHGTVCRDGSFTTGVRGVASSSGSPTKIMPGESIQFAAKNVRCDGTNSGNQGDVIERAMIGTSPDNLTTISYEIAAVEMVEN